MMEVSLPADQSGLSDLSAASIASVGPYFRQASPTLDQPTDQRSPSPTVRPSHTSTQLHPATPMPGTFRATFTHSPGPSRTNPSRPNTSGAAWTPSPDASTSRSSARRKPSPRSAANESIGSSLGTFDYSNASFSESFLRQAGAHMLAGLDETEAQPPTATPSSFSPRYRTSSSPTVTARPIRATDPRTPFTGKSLRTRMAEAGMMDSPTSSDGSSFGYSPTARLAGESSMGPFVEEGDEQGEEEWQNSPHADRFAEGSSPRPNLGRSVGDESPNRRQDAWSGEMDGLKAEDGDDWQEGLSMVPEESYVEDASQMPSSPAVRSDASHRLTSRVDPASPSMSQSEMVASPVSPSIRSSPASEQIQIQDSDAPACDAAPSSARSQSESSPETQIPALHASPERSVVANNPAASPISLASFTSPQSKASPSTPQSIPRTINTPRSFARLRMVTPIRSSPLSRVVNSTPSSAGSNSNWQSPASLRNEASPEKHAKSPTASPIGADKVVEGSSMQQLDVRDGSATVAESGAVMEDFSAQVEERRTTTPPQLAPQTPKDSRSTEKAAAAAAATPSRFWSPATSASFATPGSQHPQSWASAPATPAAGATEVFSSPMVVFGTPELPAVSFGTPQPIPSPAPVALFEVKKQDTGALQQDISLSQSAAKEEEDKEVEGGSSSCSSTSSSGRKQQGDLSTASVASPRASPPPSSVKELKLELSLSSPSQNCDSPSAARFSRLQLSRFNPTPPTNSSLAIPHSITSVPELAEVAGAFDTLTHLTDSRVSRLLAQLSASTHRIEELEVALEREEHQSVEVDELRSTLSELSGQYQELVADAERKDTQMEELVRTLQEQLKARKGVKVEELERQLEEERRLREVERRDYEVRIQGLLSNRPNSSPTQNDGEAEEGRIDRAVELAKEQLRLTLEKDFEVRRAMEQRELQERVSALEVQLSASSTSLSLSPSLSPSAEKGGDEETQQLQKTVAELTSDLDRRFEELVDLREELESMTALKDEALNRAAILQEELVEARESYHGHSRDDEREVHLEAELEELRSTLVEREDHVSHLEETLSLTNNRVSALTSELESLTHQHSQTQTYLSTAQARIGELECHIFSLESRLRTPETPPTKPTHAPLTPATEGRVRELERQLADSNLELVKLSRANEALQEDNVNFSIALSAKQLELGMVKRNARFALKHAQTNVVGNASSMIGGLGRVGLPISKQKLDAKNEVGEVEFPNAPQGELKAIEKESEKEKEKENMEPKKAEAVLNSARQHARQLLAARRADGVVATGGNGSVQERRQRLALAA